MAVSADRLLSVLPPFNNKSVLIEAAQGVHDIIKEVTEAHRYFINDYDYIYQFFYSDSIKTICRSLFDFCRENIAYVVESEDRQTTKSPSAILATGYGDCKHYAGFIGGVLSAITRNTGKVINWKYRFASYSLLNSESSHVFIVVTDKNFDYWIDPVLNDFDERLHPVYVIDKKIKDMPLYRMSGIEDSSFQYDNDFTKSIGFVDPATVATAVSLLSTFIKSSDQVPNYPIKSRATLDRLKASVLEHVGQLPPTSVEQANIMLQKAIESQARETSIGHGKGDGVGWDTLQMLYDETIEALKKYIASKGGTITPNESGSGLAPGAGAGAGLFGSSNIILWIAVAGVAFLLLRKRR